MAPAELANKLTTFVFWLLEEGLALDSKGHVARDRPGRQSFVSWTVPHGIPVPERVNYACLTEYLSLIRSHRYSAILFDGSVLQMEYVIRKRNITWHRLCYYPNPFDFEVDESDDRTLEDIIVDLDSTALREKLKLRTPVRFDYHPSGADDIHPSCHLHMIKECCRVPVRSAMPPNVFIDFVFRNFYPDEWASHESLRNFAKMRTRRTLTKEESRFVHLHWT